MNATKIVVTVEDGSEVVVFPVVAVTPAPVVTPEDVEIDVVLSDGTSKKFVPAPAVVPEVTA